MSDEEVLSQVEYRGYLLIERVYQGIATSRIRRPDGTWRYSMPTLLGEQWTGWVIVQRFTGGAIEELATAASCEEARQWVDRRLLVQ
jgi:hypothetical protein